MPSISEPKTTPIAPSLTKDPFTRKVVSRRVGQLLRRPDFAGDTEDDLTQDFLGRLADAMTRHSDEVGHRNPFIVMIVDRYVATLVEHRQASMRRTETPVSLSQTIVDSDIGAVEMAQTIGEHEQDRRLETRRLDQNDYSNLKHDLAVVLSRLTPQQQKFVRLLGDHSIADIARLMGVPRTTLNFWRAKIVKIFEEAGLHEYTS